MAGMIRIWTRKKRSQHRSIQVLFIQHRQLCQTYCWADLIYSFFYGLDEDGGDSAAAVAVEATTAALVEPAKPAVKTTNRTESSVKKTSTKKATLAPTKDDAVEIEDEKEKEKEKSQFQHTLALLELDQQNNKADTKEKNESDSTEATVGEKVIHLKFTYNLHFFLLIQF